MGQRFRHFALARADLPQQERPPPVVAAAPGVGCGKGTGAAVALHAGESVRCLQVSLVKGRIDRDGPREQFGSAPVVALPPGDLGEPLAGLQVGRVEGETPFERGRGMRELTRPSVLDSQSQGRTGIARLTARQCLQLRHRTRGPLLGEGSPALRLETCCHREERSHTHQEKEPPPRGVRSYGKP
jgi:hypothetical protein